MDRRWQHLYDEITSGVQAWRAAHPAATLNEIEEAVDEHWQTARVQLVADVVTTSAAADVAGRVVAERPTCPDCGRSLVAAGRQARTLTVQGGQLLRLERDYARCPACGAGLFPPG